MFFQEINFETKKLFAQITYSHAEVPNRNARRKVDTKHNIRYMIWNIVLMKTIYHISSYFWFHEPYIGSALTISQ